MNKYTMEYEWRQIYTLTGCVVVWAAHYECNMYINIYSLCAIHEILNDILLCMVGNQNINTRIVFLFFVPKIYFIHMSKNYCFRIIFNPTDLRCKWCRCTRCQSTPQKTNISNHTNLMVTKKGQSDGQWMDLGHTIKTLVFHFPHLWNEKRKRSATS